LLQAQSFLNATSTSNRWFFCGKTQAKINLLPCDATQISQDFKKNLTYFKNNPTFNFR
jgi:hypothetical protein